MAKSKEPSQLDIDIYTAGTVPLPPNYPELGIVSQTKTVRGDAVLNIEHRISQRYLRRYVVLREEISAIRLAKDGKLDPKTDIWLFGADARSGDLPPSADGKIYAIVYVQESVGVVLQVEFMRLLTAGEIHDMAKPCEGCKETCEGCYYCY